MFSHDMWIQVISGLGPALGQGLAGFLGSSAGWRAPFALVGAAGLLMSLGTMVDGMGWSGWWKQMF